MDGVQKATSQLTATDSSGDWIPSDQLRDAAIVALSQERDVHVSLESVEHLDASALQILLALDAGLKCKSHTLNLTGPHAALERWFHYAGATALLQGSIATSERGKVGNS